MHKQSPPETIPASFAFGKIKTNTVPNSFSQIKEMLRLDWDKIILKEVLDTRQIIGVKNKPLTKPGENYGSLMWDLEVLVEDLEGVQTTLQIAAKLVPQNQFIRNFFQTKITFRKELEFYRTIIPTLKNFNQGISDYFPEFLGGCLGQDGNDGEGAIILMQNLKSCGFQTYDIQKGCDELSTKAVLKDMAKLHATCIGLKIKKTQDYKDKVLPFLKPLESMDQKIKDEWSLRLKEDFLKIALENEFCRKNISKFEGLLKVVDLNASIGGSSLLKTFTHMDFWLNNVLIKRETNGNFLTKLIDFQLITESSVSQDLLMFLFTSVQNEVLVKFYDDFLSYYNEVLVGTLKSLEVKAEGFTNTLLEEEVGICMKHYMFSRLIFLFKFMLTVQDKVKPIEDLTADLMNEERPISQSHKEKVWILMKECVKRNWV